MYTKIEYRIVEELNIKMNPNIFTEIIGEFSSYIGNDRTFQN